MAFDECPPANVEKSVVSNAVDRTYDWIKKCQAHLKKSKPLYDYRQTLFPIVQGGIYPELRKKSLEQLTPHADCGIAIGGLAVGEDKSAMFDIIEFMDGYLPKDQPRYLMGVGRPTDLIKAIQRGVDMFDCVLPTRNARNGQLFTSAGILNIGNAEHKKSFEQICLLYTSPSPRD